MTRNRQVGPGSSADVLAALVPRITYKPGWSFTLEEIDRGQGSEGLTLVILMPVLPAAYDEESWTYWIFEQIQLVEQHEAMEFFCVDVGHPYFPEHAPGRNPYRVATIKSREQVERAAAPWHGGPPKDGHFA